MGIQVEMFRWRCFCEIRSKWFTTPYHATEETIRKDYPGAVRIDHTRKTVDIPEDPWDLCFSNMLRNSPPATEPPNFSALWRMNEKKPSDGQETE